MNRELAFSLIHNFQVKGFFRKDGINWSKQLYFIYLVKSIFLFFSIIVDMRCYSSFTRTARR